MRPPGGRAAGQGRLLRTRPRTTPALTAIITRPPSVKASKLMGAPGTAVTEAGRVSHARYISALVFANIELSAVRREGATRPCGRGVPGLRPADAVKRCVGPSLRVREFSSLHPEAHRHPG